MKSTLKYIGAILLGVVLGFLISQETSFEKPFYAELPHDYQQDELGLIKKGTQLKFDKGMDEGFSRYILYINISDAEKLKLKKAEYINEVRPYWLDK